MTHVFDWNKLKPYRNDQRKSFEQLCYQLTLEEFGETGYVTPLDDSGGGDGVEFFITLPNGDVWGWQAKFFDRLNLGGRKNQIKLSLHTAYKKHPTLKRWYLCNITDFTNEERKWFEQDLESGTVGSERVLPLGHNVELKHWGESELLTRLRQHPGVNNYFFDDKLLSWNWFQDKYSHALETSQIKQKYESQLHVSTDVDSKVIKILGGKELVDLLRLSMKENQVEMYAAEYKNDLEQLHCKESDPEYSHIQTKLREFTKDKFSILDDGIKMLVDFEEVIFFDNREEFKLLSSKFTTHLSNLHKFEEEYRAFSNAEICSPLMHIPWDPPVKEKIAPRGKMFLQQTLKLLKKVLRLKEKISYKEIDHEDKEPDHITKENKKRAQERSLLFGPYYSLGEYGISSLEQTFRILECLWQQELHISGEAGMGKTHVSFNVFEKKIQSGSPAVLIFAKDFRNSDPLFEQVQKNMMLGLPPSWKFDDFFGALNVAGRVYKSQIPIIIDGLNESLDWNHIWSGDLENLIVLIKQKYPYLTLITTYRTSYESQLFPKKYFDFDSGCWMKRARVQGFEGLTWDAIRKYFEFYKISLINRSDAIGEFKHPLYLKLFCQTKNPKRENEVCVSFQREDLFEVFDEYLTVCNEEIVRRSGRDLRLNKSYVEDKLNALAVYLWKNNVRGAPRNNEIFSDEELSLFEKENLLIFRDWDRTQEVISFTYDLLAGYLIAKNLILNPPQNIFQSIWKLTHPNISSIELFVQSFQFRSKFLVGNKRHPLFNDILRCFSVLSIKKSDIFLFNIRKDKTTKKYAMESLFEINKQYLVKSELMIKSFLSQEFGFADSREWLLNLATHIELDPEHPLNFKFWSLLINSLSMSDRDVSWGEYIRSNDRWYDTKYFSNFVDRFYSACRESESSSERVHLAAIKVMWILVTNIRKLRDEATRSLYWYARRFPDKFLELLDFSLNVNDPYVSERILAATYGLAMARQNDLNDLSFRDTLLPKYANFLFHKIFDVDSENSTTHILTRDYAKRTIDIALIHHPQILTDEQKELIKYPLTKYHHSEWGDIEDRDEGKYRDGNAPIHMDFRNYTIGRLVEGRRNYDDGNVEYKKVLGGIYWRLYDLGYSLDKFGEIDKKIADENWRNSYQREGSHTDRYGKKYAWIAFFEMAGRRNDLGLLKGWDDQDEFRVSDVDIDPSFPEKLKVHDLLKDKGGLNLLGDLTRPEDEWYETQDDLNFEKLLLSKLPFDQSKNDWILLRGFLSQKDAEDQHRDAFVAMNSILVGANDFEKILKIERNNPDFTFEHIDSVSDYYSFEGEIPWCSIIPDDYSYNLSIHFDFKGAKDRDSRIKNRDEERFEVERTIFENHWESYHSDVIPEGQSITPSKVIANYNNLFLKPQGSDMFDQSGNLASTTFVVGEKYGDMTEFTYIRRDLLEKYLRATNKKILHIQWAEKRFFANGVKHLSSSNDDKREYRLHYRIYSIM